MQNRTRAEQLIVRVTPEEKERILQKMEEYHTKNFSSYARKMLIDGQVTHFDLSEFQSLADEVNKIGVNINQIARIANTSDTVYGDEVRQLQEMMEKIWRLLKSFLSGLLSKSQ